MKPLITIMLLALGIPVGMVVLSVVVQHPAPVPVVSVTIDVAYAVNTTVTFTVTRTDGRQLVGSGAFVDPFGTIVTAGHVLTDAAVVAVKTADGSVYQACNFWVSKDSDLGFCKIDPKTPTPYLSFAKRTPRLGDVIRVIGTPHIGENVDLSGTVTQGIVSCELRKHEDGYYMQIDAGAIPGNSGGPVVNTKYEIIGILVAGVGPGVEINFAVPLDEIITAMGLYLGEFCGR